MCTGFLVVGSEKEIQKWPEIAADAGVLVCSCEQYMNRCFYNSQCCISAGVVYFDVFLTDDFSDAVECNEKDQMILLTAKPNVNISRNSRLELLNAILSQMENVQCFEGRRESTGKTTWVEIEGSRGSINDEQ